MPPIGVMAPSVPTPVCASGGAQPRWNKNGMEIFYVSLDSKMMAAPVKLSSDGRSMESGTPAALFPVRVAGGCRGRTGSNTPCRPTASDSW